MTDNRTIPMIHVAGICGDTITQEIKDLLLGDTNTVICSEHHYSILEHVEGFKKKKWMSISPVGGCLEQIRTEAGTGKILIITSGDPLFFGFGRLLIKHFSSSRIHFHPAVSSMQLCFSRFGIAWDDADIISLHGRDFEQVDRYSNSSKLFIFTDEKNNPAKIARHLLDKIARDESNHYRVYVGERLASHAERLYSGSLDETAQNEFHQPNCMIITNSQAGQKPCSRFGLKEDDFHHSRGLITKNEVRAAVIHALELPDYGVLWDIGAGSGSISIESARLAPKLSVYAIEQNPVELENIKRNRKRYGCRNVSVIGGQAPQSLASLPVPDRVFIGGNGGHLASIIQLLAAVVPVGTIIVLTAVTEKTAENAPQLLYEAGYQVEISLIQTSRSVYPGRESTVFNPIHLIVAKRKNG